MEGGVYYGGGKSIHSFRKFRTFGRKLPQDFGGRRSTISEDLRKDFEFFRRSSLASRVVQPDLTIDWGGLQIGNCAVRQILRTEKAAAALADGAALPPCTLRLIGGDGSARRKL